MGNHIGRTSFLAAQVANLWRPGPTKVVVQIYEWPRDWGSGIHWGVRRPSAALQISGAVFPEVLSLLGAN